MSDEVWMGHGVKLTKAKGSSNIAVTNDHSSELPTPTTLTHQGPITRSASHKLTKNSGV